MAIIVYKPKGVEFNKKKADGEIFFNKPLSVNYVYSDGKRLHVKKNKHYRKIVWEEIEALTKFPVVIYVNSEDKNLLKMKRSNWSPIPVNKNTVLLSAGEVVKLKGGNKERSDLNILIKKIIAKAVKKIPNLLFMEAGKWLIENTLHYTAAMIAINKTGEVTIFNKTAGEEFEKMWYFDSFLAEVASQQCVGFNFYD